VPKDHLRVEAYGAVDELNAHLGVARSMVVQPDLEEVINRIQHRLFDLGAELATPPVKEGAPPAITDQEVSVLEGVIDLYQEMLPPLREFILPAGNGIAAALHVARTVCRRAERRTVTLARTEKVRPQILKYLNRLSDLLFVIARAANARSGIPDVIWKKATPPTPAAPKPSSAPPAPGPKTTRA
jgi:cob(I)alamin adenosyltransferase